MSCCLNFKMLNPIITLLSKDVLTGDNFQKWKSNLNIVLVGENIKYILNVPKPPLPNNTATRQMKAEYNQWVASNNKTIDYMLASMFDVLRANVRAKERASLYRDYRKVHHCKDEDWDTCEGPRHDDDKLLH